MLLLNISPFPPRLPSYFPLAILGTVIKSFCFFWEKSRNSITLWFHSPSLWLHPSLVTTPLYLLFPHVMLQAPWSQEITHSYFVFASSEISLAHNECSHSFIVSTCIVSCTLHFVVMTLSRNLYQISIFWSGMERDLLSPAVLINRGAEKCTFSALAGKPLPHPENMQM